MKLMTGHWQVTAVLSAVKLRLEQDETADGFPPPPGPNSLFWTADQTRARPPLVAHKRCDRENRGVQLGKGLPFTWLTGKQGHLAGRALLMHFDKPR